MSELKPENKTGQWMALLAAFLGWMFDGMEMGIFPLIANPALTSMNVPVAEMGGWIGKFHAVFLIGAALGGLLFGWLGDRVGRVKAMTFSVLAYSLFTGMGYWATSPEMLAGLRFLAALGMGGEWSLGVALVMECWPEKHRPYLAGAIGASANVGFALIALLTMQFKVTVESWRWVMLVGAAPALLTFFIRLFVPESEKWKEAVKTSTESPVKEIFSGRLIKNTLMGILIAGVPLIVTWGAVQWIPTWVDKQLSASAVEAGGVVDVYAKSWSQFLSASGAVVGCLVAPVLGSLISRRMTYFMMCLVGLGTCGLLYGTATVYGNYFLACVFLVGMVTASFYGWLPQYLPELFPTRVRATGQGVAFNAARFLAAGGNMIAASVMASFGGAGQPGSFAKTGMIMASAYVIGMAIIWLAPETKGKPLPE